MDIITYRKTLIPRWIKFFGWLFIIMASTIPFLWAIYPFLEVSQPPVFAIFGIYAAGPPYFFGALIVQAIIAFMGISAYGLLFGKSWGVVACLINGYLGLAICLFVMVMSGFSSLQLEPLLQIPYLVRLHKIRILWQGQDNTEV